ncbi:hypothetical protein [Rhizobium sp. CF122]|uniref:hypothetical protein n=1 Tax=Rhizobium sp. CF122 TaxID=1144312 RepID=UPI00031FF8F5|nr:hypothetical protein [Rhizobium sp. CF122]
MREFVDTYENFYGISEALYQGWANGQADIRNVLLKSLRNLVLILFPGSEFASFASVILVRLVQSDANAVDVRIVEGDENPRLGDFSLLKVLQYESETLNILLGVAGLNVTLNFAINLRKRKRVRPSCF